MLVVSIDLLVAVVGLLIYAFANNNAKLLEIGRITFFCGLLAFLLSFGPAAATLVK
jgi:hypothetical protein